MASDVATAFQDFGGAVTDLFGAKGATASAGSYLEAAGIAEQNANIVKQATALKELQQSRQITQVLGKQSAAFAGAGFKTSGSAIDIMRSSASQGAITKALTAAQGSIEENSYAEQSGLYSSLAAAAKASGTSMKVGGLLDAAGGAVSLGNAAVNAGLFATKGSTAAGAAAVAGPGGDAAGAAFEAATLDAAALDTGVTAAAGDVAGAAFEAAAVDAGAEVGLTEIAAVAAWVVCTELHRQGRMPSRIYYTAAPEFLEYPERGKRGYYVWAIPSTNHLRAHPTSLYSRFLEQLFNCRARYVSSRRRGRATTWTGAFVTNGLYAFCWTLSWFVPASFAKWKSLYEVA